jgi:hypothetical protein
MSRFTVTLCRVEHRIYQIEVEAKTGKEAHDIAIKKFEKFRDETLDESDESFEDFGVVHAEEFVENVEEQEEAT